MEYYLPGTGTAILTTDEAPYNVRKTYVRVRTAANGLSD